MGLHFNSISTVLFAKTNQDWFGIFDDAFQYTFAWASCINEFFHYCVKCMGRNF